MNHANQDIPDLDSLNETELAYLIRRQTGLVVKREVGKARLVEILTMGGGLLPHEVCGTTETRRSLQMYIEKNWSGLNSQLPCKGENRGRCTIYPCPEGRHIDCMLSAASHMKLHSL